MQKLAIDGGPKAKTTTTIPMYLGVDKLFSVHLNDQNGRKFDEDKSFGAVDLRRAFNQVRIFDRWLVNALMGK